MDHMFSSSWFSPKRCGRRDQRKVKISIKCALYMKDKAFRNDFLLNEDMNSPSSQDTFYSLISLIHWLMDVAIQLTLVSNNSNHFFAYFGWIWFALKTNMLFVLNWFFVNDSKSIITMCVDFAKCLARKWRELVDWALTLRKITKKDEIIESREALPLSYWSNSHGRRRRWTNERE